MCADPSPSPADVAASTPAPVLGEAVDPVQLDPVDEVTVTTLMDNSYDGILAGGEGVRRAGLLALPTTHSAVMQEGATAVGLRAEHGFSTMVTVRRGERTSTVLFDAGVSPDGVASNVQQLGIDLDDVTAVVLSHGHLDHTGGLEGLAGATGRRRMPMVVHPHLWRRRRIVPPGKDPVPLPTLSRRAVEAEGFDVLERREPSLLLDGSLLVTGEVDRTTDFEHGMRTQQALVDGSWEPDPWILDSQALVVHLRGRGLVVVTGCGHAGAVNIVRHAMRLTGVDRLAAMLGGLHLSGPAFEPIIAPTVAALRELQPSLLVPAHCTGWRAQHQLAAALPEAFVPNAVGTRFELTAA